MPNHEIDPIFDKKSKILILGSFPSVKSREVMFYYGHPRNRFWSVMSEILGESLPQTESEKKEMLLKHGIALWDVIASCEIVGSSDSSIKNVIPNDISKILDACDIKKIFVNGKTARKYYKKYVEPVVGRDAEVLPSTSPANAAYSTDRLVNEWRAIEEYIN